MKDNKKLSDSTLLKLAEEMAGLDYQLEVINQQDPIEGLYAKQVIERMKHIKRVLKGDHWAVKKIHHKNVTGLLH